MRPIALMLCALSYVALCGAAATCDAQDVDVRLRIAWGGGESRSWQGTIAVSAGSISEPASLCLEADAPGSLVPLDAATIRVLPRTPRSYDGCDLRVRAPADAKLIVRLWAQDGTTVMSDGTIDAAPQPATPAAAGPPPEPLEVPLARVIHGFAQMGLDNRQNRLLAQRTPGDALRVRFDRQSLVFSPSERFELEVEPHSLGLAPSTSYLLSAALGPGRTEESLWTEDLEVRVDPAGRAQPTRLRVPLPPEEGVYDLRLSLIPKRLTTSIVRGKPLASRKVQLVAVAPVKKIDRSPPSWQSVLEFDPTSPRWWERMTRLPTLRRLPNMPQQPVGSSPTTTRTHQNRTWLELPPQGWQAYPLSVGEPGAPHILEIEYPSDVEQTLAISLVEPNAAGQVGPIGVDSGIDVPAPKPGHRPTVRRHRIPFWPQSRAPYVVLVNRRDEQPVVIGKVQVLAGPWELPPLAISQPNFAPRMLAAYYDKPLVAENFSATEALDPASGRALDDWGTFYQAGRRMVEVLQHGGYNAVVLTVACEGSGLYPSEFLQPTPKYDTGVFFESGQDPVRKDVLELLFRLCDRSGIQLVPAVHFASPLPRLEAIRQAGGPQAMGIEPLGADGRTWLERSTPRRGLGVYYNALDSRVQQAMVEVVAELAERYGHHASFGGVAVHIGGESFTLLPDETCSLDERTFGRFLEAAMLKQPDSNLPPVAARSELVFGQGRAAWLAWRTREMTGLYRRMRDEVTRVRPGGRLVLATGDLLGSGPLAQSLRPSLLAKEDPAQALALVGLDLKQLADDGIIVPRPQRVVPPMSAESRELHRHWNNHSDLSGLFAPQGRAAALHLLDPAPLRLPEFDAVSPFGAENTRTLFISQIVPADAAQRERFVHSLAELDAPLLIDGGWLLPLGQEAALAPMAKVYRRLPAEPFVTVRPAGQPAKTSGVVVRTLAKGGKTYFYAVNETPWPLTVEIVFQSSDALRLTPYADERQADFKQDGASATWTVAMEPYDLVGGELSSERAAVSGWRVQFPAEAAPQLQHQIDDVSRRTEKLNESPQPIGVLANPSFELPNPGGAIPGWEHAWGPGAIVRIEPTLGHASASSLHLVSEPVPGGRAPDVWVRSEPFPTPPTGRLRVVAMLRVADPAKQPPLRLAIEGRLNGQVYYRYGSVGQNVPGAPLQSKWSPFVFAVPDLPREGLKDLRIGFDLMGEGQVWIDDIQVHDLWLEKEEYNALLKSRAIAALQLQQGLLAECEAFADGFWPAFLERHVPLAPPPILPAAEGPPLPRAPDPPPRTTNPPVTSRPAKSKASPPAEEAGGESWSWRGWIPSWPKWR